MKKLISLATFLLFFYSKYAIGMHEKLIYGYVEKVELVEKHFALSAKLDTGAKTASLSAINIQQFEKDDKIYLRYMVPSKGHSVEFISEYQGKVKIKTRAHEESPGSHDILAPIRRPVVLMLVRLGERECLIRVNLTNRKRFNYPLLLGREAIKEFYGIVDFNEI